MKNRTDRAALNARLAEIKACAAQLSGLMQKMHGGNWRAQINHEAHYVLVNRSATENDLMDLEPMICELAIVADLARQITQSLPESPVREDNGGVHFTMSRGEWDQIFFLTGDAAHRAKELKAAYYRALEVEMTR